MRRLMLLRHAKSDWSAAGRRDHDRVLSARGRDAAPLMGAYMARHALVPDRALVSTATRTRETWDLVAAAFGRAVEPSFEERIYEASARTLLTVVQEAPPSAHVLLMVGHNPGMQELAGLLAGGGEAGGLARLVEKFPTAGLAVLDFPVDAWRAVAPGSGRLDRFVTPRSLNDDTD